MFLKKQGASCYKFGRKHIVSENSNYVWLFKTLHLQGFEKRVKDLRSRFDVIIETIMKDHEDARKHKEIGGVQDFA